MSHEGAGWDWIVLGDDPEHAKSIHHAILAVLMDIRLELRALNSTLNCRRVVKMADAMIALNRKVQGRRITVRDAARVMAKRRNRRTR